MIGPADDKEIGVAIVDFEPTRKLGDDAPVDARLYQRLAEQRYDELISIKVTNIAAIHDRR